MFAKSLNNRRWILKAIQGFRDAGIAGAGAALIACALTPAFPELQYEETFGVFLVIVSGLSRAFFNWLKHRQKGERGLPGGKTAAVLLLCAVLFTAASCTSIVRATGDSLAKMQAAENLYVTKQRVVEAEYTQIGAGFLRTPDHPVPLPTIGYNRVRFFYGSTPVDADDGVRYMSERDVTVTTDGENTVRSGSRTILHLDGQRYLIPEEESGP